MSMYKLMNVVADVAMEPENTIPAGGMSRTTVIICVVAAVVVVSLTAIIIRKLVHNKKNDQNSVEVTKEN